MARLVEGVSDFSGSRVKCLVHVLHDPHVAVVIDLAEHPINAV